eukprot:175984-Amphidinium_carterae.2
MLATCAAWWPTLELDISELALAVVLEAYVSSPRLSALYGLLGLRPDAKNTNLTLDFLQVSEAWVTEATVRAISKHLTRVAPPVVVKNCSSHTTVARLAALAKTSIQLDLQAVDDTILLASFPAGIPFGSIDHIIVTTQQSERMRAAHDEESRKAEVARRAQEEQRESARQRRELEQARQRQEEEQQRERAVYLYKLVGC